MMDENSGNIPSMSAGKAVEQLSVMYGSMIRAGLSPALLPPVMLWGPPGVGKSQIVRQAGEKIAAESGKHVEIIDVRLLLFNPIDLRGIPTANADKTLAVWLKPKIFQMDEGQNTVNILFLDELTAAPQSVQAAAYQITLDRVIGEHKLPDNCIVLAAGNRVTDQSVAFKMPKALANRLCHIEIETGFESWRQWAISNEIHEKVIGFLSVRRDALMRFDPSRDETAFPTPRSWEMVSRLLRHVSDNEKAIYALIAGCIGTGMATEFHHWCSVYSRLPRCEDIFAGKRVSVPKETDALHALVASMTVYAREHRSDERGIEHSIRYAMQLPVDFSVLLIRNYMAISESFRRELIQSDAYKTFSQLRGASLNGVV